MGGIGSGRGTRRKAWRSKKLKTSHLPGLKIPELIGKHKANPEAHWRLGDVVLSATETRVQVVQPGGSEGNLKSFNIASMPCHFGGKRFFGVCPACQRWVTTLYLCKTFFACRTCFKMGYETQNDTFARRVRLKMKRVHEKLNLNEWEKPKWMRKKTFERLRNEYFYLDEKEQLAHFFSLRKNSQAERLLKAHGSALAAAEMWEMSVFGHIHPRLMPLYDEDLRQHLMDVKG